MSRATPTDTQFQILARFARGDTQKEVSEATGVPMSTVEAIKRRNKSTLELIKERMVDHQISKSRKILDKTHNLIDKKLTKIEQSEQIRDEALKEYQAGTIEYKEYQQRLYGLTNATLAELNSTAREAFTQSQIESGKPTSISANTQEAKDDLLRLVEAIKAGDEEKLMKLVFNRDVIDVEVKN